MGFVKPVRFPDGLPAGYENTDTEPVPALVT
jgi:hypothetical protein